MRFIILTVLIGFWNCASPGLGPEGFIYTNSKIGFYGSDITKSKKSGQSCSHSVLGLVAFGDSSVDSAASNGGIRNVYSLNYKAFSILGIYASLCAEVNGD